MRLPALLTLDPTFNPKAAMCMLARPEGSHAPVGRLQPLSRSNAVSKCASSCSAKCALLRTRQGIRRDFREALTPTPWLSSLQTPDEWLRAARPAFAWSLRGGRLRPEIRGRASRICTEPGAEDVGWFEAYADPSQRRFRFGRPISGIETPERQSPVSLSTQSGPCWPAASKRNGLVR